MGKFTKYRMPSGEIEDFLTGYEKKYLNRKPKDKATYAYIALIVTILAAILIGLLAEKLYVDPVFVSEVEAATIEDDDFYCQQIAEGMEVVGGTSSLIKEHCARFGVTI